MKLKHLRFLAATIGVVAIAQVSMAGEILEVTAVDEGGTTNSLTAEGTADWRVWGGPSGQKDDGGGSAVGLIGALGQVGTFATTNSVPQNVDLLVTWTDGIAPAPASNTVAAIWGRDALDPWPSSNAPPPEVDIGEGFSFDTTLPEPGTYVLRAFGTARRVRSTFTVILSDGGANVTNSAPEFNPTGTAVDPVLTTLVRADQSNAILTVEYLMSADDGTSGNNHLGIKAASLEQTVLAPSLVDWGGNDMVTNGNVNASQSRGARLEAGKGELGFHGYAFDAALPLWIPGTDPDTSYVGSVVYGGAAASTVTATNEEAFLQRHQVQDSNPDKIWFRADDGTFVSAQTLACALLFDLATNANLGDLESAKMVTVNWGETNAEARLLITSGDAQYISEDVAWTSVGTSEFTGDFAALQWAVYSPGIATVFNEGVSIDAVGLVGGAEVELIWDSSSVLTSSTYHVYTNDSLVASNAWAVQASEAVAGAQTTFTDVSPSEGVKAYTVQADIDYLLDMRFGTAIDTNTWAVLPTNTVVSQIGIAFEGTGEDPGAGGTEGAKARLEITRFQVRGTPLP